MSGRPNMIPDRTADGAEAPSRHPEGDDQESEDFSRLRCSSLRTEVVAERNRRNRQPSAGYPGLAVGNSLFSGTLMKFRIIANELHNITNVQLRRAEGEVAALSKRIKELGTVLERSEKDLKDAEHEIKETIKESEPVVPEDEPEDASQYAIIQAELGITGVFAEETDKRYREMAEQISMLEEHIDRMKNSAQSS